MADARVVLATGLPFPGLRVDELPSGGGAFVTPVETQTDADGGFELELALRGDVACAVRHAGFAPLRFERTLEARDDGWLGDLVLERGAVLAGHVVDATGRGVAGATLHDTSRSGGMSFSFAGGATRPLATTDDGGAFRVDELPAGPFRLRIDHPDHPSALASGHIARPGEELGAQRYVLETGGVIEGRVLGLEVGRAGELLVRAQPSQAEFGDALGGPAAVRTAALDAGGRFALRGLRLGETYRVSAIDAPREGFPELFADARSSVALAECGRRDVELDLRATPTLLLKVVDAESGEPIEHFRLEAGAPWRQPLQDAEGRVKSEFPGGVARYADVPLRGEADTISARVTADGYVPWEREDVALAAGEVTDLGEVRLERAPRLVVRVVDASTREPVRGARVRVRAAESDDFEFGFDVDDAPEGSPFAPPSDGTSGRTDADGRVALDLVTEGEVVVTARAKGFAERRTAPQLPPSSGELELALARGGTVVVRVLDPGGRPVAGAEVRHHEPEAEPGRVVFGGPGGSKTDADGTLTFANLVPGRHAFELVETSGPRMAFGGARIRIGGLGGDEPAAPPGEAVVVSEGSEHEVVLRAKPRGVLDGVVSEAGQPLAGARVSFERKQDDGGGAAGLALFGGDDGYTTNGKGEYHVDGLTVGEYTARITHPTRAMPSTWDVSVAEGPQTCDFPLTITSLEGHVVDDEGHGVAGVEVRAVRDGGASQPARMGAMVLVSSGGGGAMTFGVGDGAAEPTRTDAEGYYLLRGVEPDVDLHVATSSPEHQDARSASVRVAAGEALGGVDVTVHGAGSVNVRVLDAGGGARGFCLVRGTYLEELEEGDEVEPVREFAGEDGTAHLAGLRPGRWRFLAESLGGGPGGPGGPGERASSTPLELEVRAGEPQELSLQLP
ncbi:MAG: carboxypeptidase regulatory-like domain-containing protein [Planctomycetes bacterium]|nr:carboxypeptidase regulatory-like domain-containing protein [Planctomycetota bacterium]